MCSFAIPGWRGLAVIQSNQAHNALVGEVLLLVHFVLVGFNLTFASEDLVDPDGLGLTWAVDAIVGLQLPALLPPRSAANNNTGALDIETLPTGTTSRQHDPCACRYLPESLHGKMTLGRVLPAIVSENGHWIIHDVLQSRLQDVEEEDTLVEDEYTVVWATVSMPVDDIKDAVHTRRTAGLSFFEMRAPLGVYQLLVGREFDVVHTFVVHVVLHSLSLQFHDLYELWMEGPLLRCDQSRPLDQAVASLFSVGPNSLLVLLKLFIANHELILGQAERDDLLEEGW